MAPSAALLRETYERLFLAAPQGAIGADADAGSKTVLILVIEGVGQVSESDVARACQDAWASASAAMVLHGMAFGDVFDLEVVTVPSTDPEGFSAGVAAIKSRIAGLGGGFAPKVARPGAFAEAAQSAWTAAGSHDFCFMPSEVLLHERFLAARSYEAAYAEAQSTLRKWAPIVSKGSIVRGFGSAASAMLEGALSTFDAGVIDCSAASAPMLAQRRTRLQKELQNDVQELFTKQWRQVTVSTMNQFKAGLLKVVARAGTVANWQLEALRHNAEKHFDEAIGQLLGPGDTTRAQWTRDFGKQLTEMTQEYIDSPAMQLQKAAAMQRKMGKAPKRPRGIRAGLGLVGALRSKWAGGQGNLQTFAGYTSGLNSAHLVVANDGGLADSQGDLPPLFRWQPKVNFDISI
jgi:hypothetical protein